ncbi:MAG TPA: ABC transporter ATP-binding protein [Pirellulales bacterium]|nr:ABC transporter ATP-binding protein [Pirellulales bacterium]
MQTAEPAIDVQAIRKTYRDGLFGRRRIEALRGVSFQVARGEIFGLLGPNGAGKTTLIKVLLGIVRKSGGAASLLGRPPGDRRGRSGVGYLPEGHRIPQHHTGNTALEYYGSLSGLSQHEIRRRRGELLETVGLAEWGGTSVKKYSKGMLQRLGLAQAMLHDPELLILDEPTDGVDPVGRKEMRSLLQQLKAQGKTVFINSHLLQEIELVCDRVAILVRGEVQKVGGVEELTLRPQTEVTFTLLGAEAPIRSALAGDQIDSLKANGPGQFQLTARLADQAAVDRVVDSLRRHGVSVASMTRNRQTLEDAFLGIVQAQETAATPEIVEAREVAR